MQKKGVPKSFQIKISEYCNELWSGKGFDTVELFKEVPPAMRLHLTSFLYGKTFSFGGASHSRLCNVLVWFYDSACAHWLVAPYKMSQVAPLRTCRCFVGSQRR